MTITLDLDYDEAQVLLCRFKMAMTPAIDATDPLVSVFEAISEAVENESARLYDQQQQSLMESGGPDDSAYRQQLRDAGRGHLIR